MSLLGNNSRRSEDSIPGISPSVGAIKALPKNLMLTNISCLLAPLAAPGRLGKTKHRNYHV